MEFFIVFLTFGVFIGLISIFLIWSLLSGLFYKKKINAKLDKIFLELREYQTRITILETRVSERSLFFHPSEKTKELQAKRKRGRPRKNSEG